MQDDDEMVLPDTQPETQTSTQPFEADDHVVLSSQVDVSIDQQPTEDSFHSAQENVRRRGETVEPMKFDPTPTKERTTRPAESVSKALEPEMNLTPKPQTQLKPTVVATAEKRQSSPPAQQAAERADDNEHLTKTETSEAKKQENQSPDVEMEDTVKEDTILDDVFDDIGSPSDGSTPERFPVRKSSLNFASLPAREPLKRLSRTSHIDLAKLNNTGRPSLGKQSGGQRVTQTAVDEDMADAYIKMPDDEKESEDTMDVDRVSKEHTKKSTQSLHERISMLGKLQPSRPKKSIASIAGLSAGQVPYPELPVAKPETKLEPSSQKGRATPAQVSNEMDVDDWIRPLSSPQRLDLTRSKTADVMEKLFDVDQPTSKTFGANAREQQSTEPERPKSSYSIFSSPRPHGHQKTASVSNIASEASTTPTGSPRRFDGPLSASKMRLQSIMKSAKGLFTSTGSSTRLEHSSPEQPRLRPQEQASTMAGTKHDQPEPQPRQISSPPRQEGRRTRSSTEREEKRRQKEQEDRQREEEELQQERAREKEKQRSMQLRAAQDKSSVEPEDKASTTAAQRPMQSQRQHSREPESAHNGSRFGLPQPKQNERRPKPPTREPAQKPNPRPVSIRVGSTLSRPMPMSTSMASDSQESVAPPPAPPPATKAASLKKKGSNQSLHASSSASSFKSSVSSQTQAQRKKREQEEREVRRKEEQRKEEQRKEEQRKEEQKREADRRRALQKQQEEEAQRQAEAERAERERSAQEDPKKSAHMRAIERRRQENNARKHVRQGSQQPVTEVKPSHHHPEVSLLMDYQAPVLQHEKSASQSSQRNDLGATRPASRLGYGRPINPPAPNPAKPPKRNMEEEAGYRAAVANPSNVQPSGEAKRRKTEDEHNPMQPVRPTMAPPIRQSNIRKVSSTLLPQSHHQ